jgi:hypothetical protein
VKDPATTVSAGKEKNLRRWRVTLSVVAWLIIVQSGLGLLSGLVSIPLSATIRPEDLESQLGPLAGEIDLAPVDRLFGQLRMLNLVQVGANALMLGAGIGLLSRRKWGWYGAIIINLLEAAGMFVIGLPALEPVLRLLDPARAETLSIVIAVLLALVPASIVAFLLARPVVRQFETR